MPRLSQFPLPAVLSAAFLLLTQAMGAEPAPAGTEPAAAAGATAEKPAEAKPPALELERMQVTTKRETFFNTIDRKTYNVGKDIQSTTGSANDLLQNIPSVQVDVDGNLSLRGSEDVLVLIDGKPSTLMGRNRAAVLDQLPADSIEKIEVITNPSAKYKPDGTAGIINITMKRKRDPGYSASVRANVGTDGRINGSLSANYNPGRVNVFGTFALRQDYRLRTSGDERSHLDSATNTMLATTQHAVETSRPLSRVAQAGVDYRLSDDTKLGASVNYNLRTFLRKSVETYRAYDAAGDLVGDYDRARSDPEREEDKEYAATLQHSWPVGGHELKLDFRHSRTSEAEPNTYTNTYRLPVATPVSSSQAFVFRDEENTEFSVEGSYAVNSSAKLESGYSWQSDQSDFDFRGADLDPASGAWVVDAARTNRFGYESGIHALYATFGRPWGAFGAMGGLRFEHATIDTDQRTTHQLDRTVYAKLYPTLHLNYALTEASQLQLNFSQRVRRPDAEDLNPYPEYLDPFNLRAGNPHLRPEDIKSIEGGYQYKHDDTTLLAALYYRIRSNGFTQVTRYIDSTTLLTTYENLASSRAGGLELSATTSAIKNVVLNFSANLYRNEIDASNLGFSGTRSAFAWEAKLNATWNVSKNTSFQINTNYSAKRLTPQGYRFPTSVVNLGLRHNFPAKHTAVVLTVSDLFDTLRERTLIDTPALHDEVTRRRNPRIVYLGVIYNFGKSAKKSKDDLQFDNQF